MTLRIDEHPPPAADPTLLHVIAEGDGVHVLLIDDERVIGRAEWRTVERLMLEARRALGQVRPRAARRLCALCGGSGRVMDAPTGPGSYGPTRSCPGCGEAGS